MKPCEFPGWMEVELDDFTKDGDIWFRVNGGSFGPIDDAYNALINPPGIDRRLRSILVRPADREDYRLFRRTGGRRLPLNPHFSEALPLP